MKIREYNNCINKLRMNGELDKAILLTRKAIIDFPKNNFYHKLLGDILFQDKQYKKSYISYLNFLKYIDDNYKLYKVFVKYFNRLETCSELDALNFRMELQEKINTNEYSPKVIELLLKFLRMNDYRHIPNGIIGIINKYNNSKLNTFSSHIKNLEKKHNNILLNYFLEYRINNFNEEKKIDKDTFLVSILEKKNKYNDAISLASEIISQKKDPIVIRSFFRISRKMNDYSYVDSLLLNDNSILSIDNFNIQYELFYYHMSRDDFKSVKTVLTKIKNKNKNSLSINKTLYNFYLSAGFISDAKEIQERISNLLIKEHNKFRYNKNGNDSSTDENINFENLESEDMLYKNITQLFEEQEHTRKMIAIQELLKGFSHEVGQPLTNIRFLIQLYNMKKEKNLNLQESIDDIFGKILLQTERLGRLLKRFTPIVSQKKENTSFLVKQRFKQVFYELGEISGNIKYEITGNDCRIVGSPIQFDQIIYNLTLNAIQSIKDSKNKDCGKINVNINNKKNTIISFEDNGIGIESLDKNKIFQPFYTTKDITKGEGGEGLGLYIVWNIVKMFRGNIKLDTKYSSGAKFILYFKKG